MNSDNNDLEMIGRSTELFFVDFSDTGVPAKIDTGAYRSAVHATDIYIDNNKTLHFRISGNHPVCHEIAFNASTNDYRIVNVANSFGDQEQRYEVKLRVKIGNQEFITPFTLANRQKKIYPILIGRKTIRKRYLVDVGKSGVDRVKLKEKYKINLPEDEETDSD